jgi:peroxiredoxin
VIVHDTMENGRYYFAKYDVPFPGLVDEDHAVYDRYDVASKALSLGQRPGLFIVDKAGIVRFAYVGSQQWQIPPNSRVLAQLDALNTAEAKGHNSG